MRDTGAGNLNANAIPCPRILHPASFIRSPRRLRAFVQHRPQLFEEIVDVVELAIDAGEAHERHLVEVAEVAHHELAQLAAFHFALELLIDVVLDRGGRGFDLPRW